MGSSHRYHEHQAGDTYDYAVDHATLPPGMQLEPGSESPRMRRMHMSAVQAIDTPLGTPADGVKPGAHDMPGVSMAGAQDLAVGEGAAEQLHAGRWFGYRMKAIPVAKQPWDSAGGVATGSRDNSGGTSRGHSADSRGGIEGCSDMSVAGRGNIASLRVEGHKMGIRTWRALACAVAAAGRQGDGHERADARMRAKVVFARACWLRAAMLVIRALGRNPRLLERQLIELEHLASAAAGLDVAQVRALLTQAGEGEIQKSKGLHVGGGVVGFAGGLMTGNLPVMPAARSHGLRTRAASSQPGVMTPQQVELIMQGHVLASHNQTAGAAGKGNAAMSQGWVSSGITGADLQAAGQVSAVGFGGFEAFEPADNKPGRRNTKPHPHSVSQPHEQRPQTATATQGMQQPSGLSYHAVLYDNGMLQLRGQVNPLLFNEDTSDQRRVSAPSGIAGSGYRAPELVKNQGMIQKGFAGMGAGQGAPQVRLTPLKGHSLQQQQAKQIRLQQQQQQQQTTIAEPSGAVQIMQTMMTSQSQAVDAANDSVLHARTPSPLHLTFAPAHKRYRHQSQPGMVIAEPPHFTTAADMLRARQSEASGSTHKDNNADVGIAVTVARNGIIGILGHMGHAAIAGNVVKGPVCRHHGASTGGAPVNATSAASPALATTGHSINSAITHHTGASASNPTAPADNLSHGPMAGSSQVHATSHVTRCASPDLPSTCIVC